MNLLQSVTITNAVESGQSASGTVTLVNVAATGGVTVVLGSNLSCVTPQAVGIPAGAKTASFDIMTTAVAQDQTGAVTASLEGQTLTAPLAVYGIRPLGAKTKPLARFDSGGTPPVISYDVPEGVSYSGRHYIELPLADAFGATFFSDAARQRTYTLPPLEDTLESKLESYMIAGFVSGIPCDAKAGVTPTRPPLDWYFPSIPLEIAGRLKRTARGASVAVVIGMDEDGELQTMQYEGVYLDNNGTPAIEEIAPMLRILTPAEVGAAIRKGMRLHVYQNESGQYDYRFIEVPSTPTPRLAIVEEYRLTTFLGQYGVGRTLKTMSLLPGEKTNITVKTYTRTTTLAKEASSIFDSATQEASDEFQQMADSENTDKRSASRTDEWHVSAKATGRWGIGHASVSAGAAGSATSAREQFSKAVHGAAQKQANKASSKRDVSVELASETRTESGEETGSMREVQNINVGSTLNFVFRQLNQEFISILHLVDVRIAFANGMPGSDRIVSLEEMDMLLADVIAAGPAGSVEANRDRVRGLILSQLDSIVDYQGALQSITQVQNLASAGEPPRPYYRVRRDLSVYKDEATQSTFRVPGLILSVDRNVLRTDGVIVETLLGEASGLDVYSTLLQEQAIEAKSTANTALTNEVALERAKHTIVREHQKAAAQAFATMFPPTPPSTTTTSTATAAPAMTTVPAALAPPAPPA